MRTIFLTTPKDLRSISKKPRAWHPPTTTRRGLTHTSQLSEMRRREQPANIPGFHWAKHRHIQKTLDRRTFSTWIIWSKTLAKDLVVVVVVVVVVADVEVVVVVVVVVVLGYSPTQRSRDVVHFYYHTFVAHEHILNATQTDDLMFLPLAHISMLRN